MQKMSVKSFVLSGMMIALVFLVTKFLGFASPFGYFNLGDAVIMTIAVLLGRNRGFIAGAIGSALSDVLTPGYIMFAPLTFVVKGLEGYVVGSIVHPGQENIRRTRIIAVIAGACIMIAGYFLGETFLLNLVDKTYGFPYAIKELVATNIPQGALSSVLSYALTAILIKADVKRYI